MDGVAALGSVETLDCQFAPGVAHGLEQAPDAVQPAPIAGIGQRCGLVHHDIAMEGGREQVEIGVVLLEEAQFHREHAIEQIRGGKSGACVHG